MIANQTESCELRVNIRLCSFVHAIFPTESVVRCWNHEAVFDVSPKNRHQNEAKKATKHKKMKWFIVKSRGKCHTKECQNQHNQTTIKWATESSASIPGTWNGDSVPASIDILVGYIVSPVVNERDRTWWPTWLLIVLHQPTPILKRDPQRSITATPLFYLLFDIFERKEITNMVELSSLSASWLWIGSFFKHSLSRFGNRHRCVHRNRLQQRERDGVTFIEVEMHHIPMNSHPHCECENERERMMKKSIVKFV